jgi:agmatine/peptidylarginine deiminase
MLKRKFLLLTLVLQACTAQTNDSKNKGHYEDMSKAEVEAILQKKPFVLAETEKTSFVSIGGSLVLSEKKQGFGRIDLALSILKAGSDLAIFAPPGTQDIFNDPLFAEFSEAARDYKAQIRTIPSRSNMPGVWARDWAPLQAVSPQGEQILLDFNYYPERPTGDVTPQILSEISPKNQRLSVPVYNEGGNFMSNSRGVCMMTTRVLDANKDNTQKVYVDKNGKVILGIDGYPISSLSNDRRRDLGGRRISASVYYDINDSIQVRSDDMILDEAMVKEYYQKYAGCKQVHIFPRMPEEGTGHIDMFAKFLSDDVILLNEISEAEIQKVQSTSEKVLAIQISQYLEKIALEMRELGFQVSRVPMPIPQLRKVYAVDSSYEYFVIRSYTNSLLVIREGSKVAIVPRYSKAELASDESNAFGKMAGVQEYTDSASIANYEIAVQKAYQDLGYSIDFITTDRLIANGGSVHCVTMQFSYPL